jgi:Glyoxalase-like domain
MHRSRLAGFIIDCKNVDPDRAAAFWSSALGLVEGAREGDRYRVLDASARDLHVEVQNVEHESRVHLDIESEDVEAEVARLEALGARRLEKRNTWWVLEAPTGQRFCVVRAKRPLAGAPGAREWP